MWGREESLKPENLLKLGLHNSGLAQFGNSKLEGEFWRLFNGKG